MNQIPAVQAGLSGVARGLEQLQEISHDIASTGTVRPESNETTADLTQSLADLSHYELATQASIKVVATAGEVLGTFIDTVA